MLEEGGCRLLGVCLSVEMYSGVDVTGRETGRQNSLDMTRDAAG
jgi:hypothetical protein